MNSTPIAAGVTVSGQLEAPDFALLARQGVRLVINNRLDGEAPGQLTAAQAREAAEQIGIAYRHIPVTFPTLQPADIDRFGEAVATAPGPVHAHCASGRRSTALWALSKMRHGTIDRGEAAQWARQHGIDLAEAFAWLDRQPA